MLERYIYLIFANYANLPNAQGWIVQNSIFHVFTILVLESFLVLSMDLTEGSNAKLVTKFLLNNQALDSLV
jgi:hypothetical protein